MHKTFTKTKPKFGDVVFIDGREDWNVIGKMIRFLENGAKHPTDKFMPNHIGMIVEVHKEIEECKIIQSGWAGVKIISLKFWSNNSKTNIIVKRCNRPIFERRKRILKKWLLRQVGKKYDYLALVNILIRFIILQIIDNKIIKYFIRHLPNFLSSKIKFTCSELVARAFTEAVGIHIFKDIDSANITPYDEYRSKKLRTIAKIINFEYK